MAEEKRFENKVKEYLKSKGCWFVKFFANNFTKAGVPDLIVCVNGHFLAVEVKSSKGKPSALQLCNIEEIRKAGGTAIVLYPDQFDDFKEIVEKLCK